MVVVVVPVHPSSSLLPASSSSLDLLEEVGGVIHGVVRHIPVQ